MKPRPFDYIRPDTVEEVLALLADYGDDARILAGGQSLLPMLNLRLIDPAVLIDIARITELDAIKDRGDFIEIGAFLVIGAAISAALNVLVESKIVVQFAGQNVMATVTMMGMALVLNLCSEADAFVAANFPLFWPPASKMAFLVLGPMLDLKLYIMYTRVFRSRLIYTIIITVVLQVFLYAMIVHYCSLLPAFQKVKE